MPVFTQICAQHTAGNNQETYQGKPEVNPQPWTEINIIRILTYSVLGTYNLPQTKSDDDRLKILFLSTGLGCKQRA